MARQSGVADPLGRNCKGAAGTVRGVVFTEPPREEPYGFVAVFKDLYGNRIDLIQRQV